jgi:hypothetical protein
MKKGADIAMDKMKREKKIKIRKKAIRARKQQVFWVWLSH